MGKCLSPLKRLAIGTAQIGGDYGIANKKGKVEFSEVEKLLAVARQAGIDTLDTAMNYGIAEVVLGSAGVTDFRIISKLPAIPEDELNVARWVEAQVEGSLKRLNVSRLHGLLLHNPVDLLGRQGADLFATLGELKKNNIITKIGVSVYTTEELRKVISKFRFDIVQLPLNVFDNRFHSEGLIDFLALSGVEVHARSIFLQGLLLLSIDQIPVAFSKYRFLFEEWGHWVRTISTRQDAAMAACWAHAASFSNLNKIIVGLDNSRQLQEILDLRLSCPVRAPSRLESLDLNLILPSRWGALRPDPV